MNQLNILHIDTPSELLHFKEDIFRLFLQSFGFNLNSDLWEWAYLNNPLGSPLINLAFLKNQLVGHYAFIPIATTKYKTLLSMTTMVCPSARKYNVFLDLADKSYIFAQKQGYDLIIGFPNPRSAIIHEKLLNWKIEKTYVAQCSREIVNKYSYNIFSTEDKLCRLDIDDSNFLKWRLSKPNTFYKKDKKTIYKHFNQSEIDLLTIREEVKPCIFYNSKINFLTQGEFFDQYKKFDYPFAYKNLQESSIKRFHMELLMSDIF